MLDSEQNVQNHVFPFMLGQVSKQEFQELEKDFSKVQSDVNEMAEKIEDIDAVMYGGKFKGVVFPGRTDVHKEYYKLKEKSASLVEERNGQLVFEGGLEDFEIANLLRLGILVSVPKIREHEKEELIISTWPRYSDLGVMFLNACLKPEEREGSDDDWEEWEYDWDEKWEEMWEEKCKKYSKR